MKKLFLTIMVAVGVSLSATAQDVIVLLNTEEIQAKVKSIGLNEVVYLKWNNLNGPTYSIAKSDIFYIKYTNGQKDIFGNHDQHSSTNRSIKKTSIKEDCSKVKFQGYSYLGADFNDWMGGPSIDFSFGARTSKYFYIGGGVGWHNLIGEDYFYTDNYFDSDYEYYTLWLPYLTFTSDIKVYIPTKSCFTPRFDISFGGTVDAIDAYAGLYLSFGAGFDYKLFSFGAGYQMPVYADVIIPQGYVRIGVRFGKK